MAQSENPLPIRSVPLARPRQKRFLYFRVAAALGVSLFVLVAAELLLRAAGYGYVTSFFIRHALAGSNVLVENPRFGWRFFARPIARRPPPLIMASPKPAGTFRIFVFGESAAAGDPDPASSFARMLEVLLRERHPGVNFEVINTAFVAINSHVILPIAREAAKQQGDLWLIYMGNNEPTGPFGADPVYTKQTPPLSLIRLLLALKTTRLTQFIDDLEQRTLRKNEAAQIWAGMQLHLPYRVRSDDRRLSAVYQNFQRNLEDMLRAGEGSKTPIILSTVAVNLRDCAPFASQHRPDITAPELANWEKAFQSAVASEKAAEMDAAIKSYQEAERIDPGFAELHFRLGKCRLALGQSAEAKKHFERARDLDTLRFRADSKINDLIRQQAASHPGTRLLDASDSLARETKDGIPGAEWFYEHVHFRFEGNYLLARLFADEVARALPVAITDKPKDAWLPLNDCTDRLGLGSYSRDNALRAISGRLEQAPFTSQSNHAATMSLLAEERSKLRPHTKSVGVDRDIRLCEGAVARWPSDRALHDLLAYLMRTRANAAGAEREWKRVLELAPHYSSAYVDLGKLKEDAGDLPTAETYFQKALVADPDYAEAHFRLGLLAQRQNHFEAAEKHFRKTLVLQPGHPDATKALQQLSSTRRK